MMCSNSYLNHYIKVGQLPKCVISSIEMAGQPLVKRAVSSAEICSLSKELKESEKERKKLEKELARKEKALAETAALLVLRKKADAIWGDPEDE